MFKKMTKNIHLLNIQKIRSLNNFNKNSFNINDKSPSNKSFIRIQHISFNSYIQNIEKK